MSRYIDAEKIELKFPDGYDNDGLLYVPFRSIQKCIDNTPTIDVESVRHGHWIDKTIQIGIPKYHYIFCSECESGYNIVYVHLLIGDGKLFDCCPSCGAKMDKGARVIINEQIC